MHFSRYSKAALLVAALLLPILACSKPGSEFVGKWVNTKNANEQMEIVRNGDEFLIVEGSTKVGALYKDGGLEIAGALGNVRLTYVKSSGTILAPGMFGQTEFKRAR